MFDVHEHFCIECVIFLILDIHVLQVLNQIVYELPAEHPLAESRPLRELLGHTPPQVCFIALNCVITFVRRFCPIINVIHMMNLLVI